MPRRAWYKSQLLPRVGALTACTTSGYQVSAVRALTSTCPLLPNTSWLLRLRMAHVLHNLQLPLVLIVPELFLINLLAGRSPAKDSQMGRAQAACTTMNRCVRTGGKKEPPTPRRDGVESTPCQRAAPYPSALLVSAL